MGGAADPVVAFTTGQYLPSQPTKSVRKYAANRAGIHTGSPGDYLLPKPPDVPKPPPPPKPVQASKEPVTAVYARDQKKARATLLTGPRGDTAMGTSLGRPTLLGG